MIAHRLFLFLCCTIYLASCARVTNSISSVPSLSEVPGYDTDKTYSHSDEEISREISIGGIDLYLTPYNYARTSNYLELMFIPVEKKDEYISEAGKAPFKVEVWVKGEKGLFSFEPLQSRYNGKQIVASVMQREGDPGRDCKSHYHYYEWQPVDNKTSPMVADRTRNEGKSCYSQGWIEFLIEFNDITPKPENMFNIELYFTNTKSNKMFSQKVYFHGAKFKSVTTH